MSAPPVVYPWYVTASGDDLEQGDIFERCPVFSPPADLGNTPPDTARFRWEDRDLIVLSQSCDLVKAREKVEEVLLCAVWGISEFKGGIFSQPKGLEDARRGNLPSYHMLAACTIPECIREVRIVDFRRVYSLPVRFLRSRTSGVQRIRLLPPYREHLSQAFARYFMRVGLPSDIPSFR